MRFDPKMLAYCGIYCEQCSFRTAFIEQDFRHVELVPAKFKGENPRLSDYDCEGCKGRNLCGPCKIKDCAVAKGIESCGECGGYPCETISAFHRDGVPHHGWAGENLRSIRQSGIESWFTDLQPAIHCHCGARQSWYHACPEHG